MASLARAFRALAAAVRAVIAAIHYLQRRRNGGRTHPKLRLAYIHPPYWGGVRLDLAIRNAGDVTARDCRYCRLQRFTMEGPADRPPPLSVVRWYATERFTVPAGGEGGAVAVLTRDPCPREILGDLASLDGGDISSHDAIVCRDAAGTMYRFRPELGPDAPPDVWSKGLLDRFRGRTPPPWTRWITASTPIRRVEWG